MTTNTISNLLHSCCFSQTLVPGQLVILFHIWGLARSSFPFSRQDRRFLSCRLIHVDIHDSCQETRQKFIKAIISQQCTSKWRQLYKSHPSTCGINLSYTIITPTYLLYTSRIFHWLQTQQIAHCVSYTSRFMEESKDSLLSELLSSGGEIEGLFQQKKRKGLKNFAFMNSSRAFREPGEILQEQITAYNRRKSIQCQLSLQEVSKACPCVWFASTCHNQALPVWIWLFCFSESTACS